MKVNLISSWKKGVWDDATTLSLGLASTQSNQEWESLKKYGSIIIAVYFKILKEFGIEKRNMECIFKLIIS